MDYSNDSEINFLLLALKQVAGHGDLGPLSAVEVQDWDKLIRLASSHGVSLLLFSLLSKQPQMRVPQNVLSILKNQFLQNLKKNIGCTTHLVRALTLLHSQGIRAIPFKGPALGELAYGDLGLRVFSDVDVLVRPGDFLRTYNLLRKKGWRTVTILSDRTKRLWVRSRRDLEFTRAGYVMDCHQQVAQGPHFFSQENQMLKETQEVTLLDRKFSTLSPEFTVISICLNGTKDQWHSLKPITDLSLYLSRNSRINWDRLLGKAKAMGMQNLLLLGLNLCRELLSFAPPPDMMKKITKRPAIKRHTRQILNRIFK